MERSSVQKPKVCYDFFDYVKLQNQFLFLQTAFWYELIRNK